ncbi:MAG: histidine kinase [Epulopiscium sp. Nele67-Bin002]|nr:MAG: histidine kinase [Epulopiscium sp. Nuni2H_MBin001]OON91291.1 MAG: histidine kinase [Epulopiscium sp. Nele67-Bin002]
MLFSILSYSRIESYFIGNSKTEWTRQANLVATRITENSSYLKDGRNYNEFTSQISAIGSELSISARVVVVDSQGFIVADSSKIDVNNMLLTTQVLNALNKRNSAEKVFQYGQNIMSTAVAIRDEENPDNVLGVVVLSANIDDVYIWLEELATQIYLLSLLTSLLMGLLSFFTSSLITRPVQALMRSVQKVTSGQLEEKIIVSGKGEMAELAEAFNHMTEQLQRVDESRQEFVANVSHELKTPLASVKVLTESLMFQDNVPIEMYQEFFYDINSEVDRLNNIITDLLSLVKLDSNKVHLNITETYLNALTEAILKRLEPIARKKNITLIYESHQDILIDADEVKLTLAISNLIENGIKYTKDGGNVKVTIQSDLQDAFITVVDTGVGIAKEEQPRIFERFYRTDKTRNRETGGTGLGLAITYRTVIMHNGSIQVNSTEGVGSTFVIQIPIKQV